MQRAVDQTAVSARRRARTLSRHAPVRHAWHLVSVTLRLCLRYRVTGLAAEAGFFALLSLPPLLLGLAASAAWVGSELGADTELQLKNGLRDYLSPFLTSDVVNTVMIPTLEDAIDTPRIDLISLGFVLSLWSGSRALNVYIDTISIMYGQGGHRGIVRTRVLSFGLYGLTLLLGAVTVPLVLVGPVPAAGRAAPVPGVADHPVLAGRDDPLAWPCSRASTTSAHRCGRRGAATSRAPWWPW